MTEEKQAELTRRGWLELTLAAGSAWVVGGSVAADVSAAETDALQKGGVILFQGDSITDAGRDRKREEPNNARGFGQGYPLVVASYLLGTRPEAELKIYNRGISGHKVPDLDRRWQKDTIDLQPDILSILVGVNDIWHKLSGKYEGTVESYESGYTALLERTRKALPQTRLVVCEPFVLRCGAVNEKWFPEFTRRREAAKRVAEEAGAVWVPFQTMFDDAATKAPPSYWAGDGVHPSMAGHGLMAKTWLETVRP